MLTHQEQVITFLGIREKNQIYASSGILIESCQQSKLQARGPQLPERESESDVPRPQAPPQRSHSSLEVLSSSLKTVAPLSAFWV